MLITQAATKAPRAGRCQDRQRECRPQVVHQGLRTLLSFLMLANAAKVTCPWWGVGFSLARVSVCHGSGGSRPYIVQYGQTNVPKTTGLSLSRVCLPWLRWSLISVCATL